MTGPLRVGLLGASRIAQEALVTPAADGLVRLVAVAARDHDRAARFAAENGIERAFGSYQELLADPDVEVVYNALPNSLHGPWNMAAVQAGKHVFSEKPFASNAPEARQVAAVAAQSDRVVFDAFHYHYHPVFRRFLAVIAGGEIGSLTSLHVRMTMPPPGDNDLRWSLPPAGGAMMDLGCYALHVAAAVAGELGGGIELVEASMGERAGCPGVDQRFTVELALPGGARAALHGDMGHPDRESSLRADGDGGHVVVKNFIKVSADDRLIVYSAREGERVEHLGTRSSYHYQMDALTAAVRFGSPFPTNAADAVNDLELIDQCYRMAGFPVRPSHVPEPEPPSRTA
ncbi:Gfo/Idh/MocA family oxidoreductase [Actinoplanes sp. NPDC051475]|uniref:Gfo/Idh/MocA family protein n=1 Tax=Actinoplanes sp. NPDC051475 TaxID=3157225 RepID=UPI003450CF64